MIGPKQSRLAVSAELTSRVGCILTGLLSYSRKDLSARIPTGNAERGCLVTLYGEASNRDGGTGPDCRRSRYMRF